MRNLPALLLIFAVLGILFLGINRSFARFYDLEKRLTNFELNKEYIKLGFNRLSLYQKKENPFKITSPTNLLLSSSSAKISANTDSDSLTVILGCENDKEIIIESFLTLNTDCTLKPGVNEINIFNFDSNYIMKEEILGLLVSNNVSLPVESSSLTGTVLSIKDSIITLDEGKKKEEVTITPQTKYYNERLEELKLNDLRIADKVIVYTNSKTAVTLIQLPMSTLLKKYTAIYSKFKELKDNTLILPNLGEKDSQPKHIKVSPETRTKLKNKEVIDLSLVKFEARTVVIGKYDEYGNIHAETVYILDKDWKKEQEATESAKTQ